MVSGGVLVTGSQGRGRGVVIMWWVAAFLAAWPLVEAAFAASLLLNILSVLNVTLGPYTLNVFIPVSMLVVFFVASVLASRYGAPHRLWIVPVAWCVVTFCLVLRVALADQLSGAVNGALTGAAPWIPAVIGTWLGGVLGERRRAAAALRTVRAADGDWDFSHLR
jgi:hypothetical protein